jgi:two-component system chemotaxis response regulator CheB
LIKVKPGNGNRRAARAGEGRVPDITVIIAGANPVMRSRLVKAIGASAGLEVIAEAADLPAAYTASEALEPQVILISRELTTLAEFSLMKSLFRALNIRWITVDHRVPGAETGPALPTGPNEIGIPPLDSALPPADISRQIVAASRLALKDPAPAPRAVIPSLPMRPGKLILIGASTGGVDALLSVLSALPATCPPVAVVQHTGQGFSESLIRLLARRCALRVEPARHGMDLRPGMVAIAAGCPGHMRLCPGKPPRLSLQAGPPVSGHVPSVDALFASAVPMADQIVAALLTGMGRDGANGLLALRRAGAVTIGQDAPTSVVYGMPRAAWEIGAVQQQVSLGDIAATILRACALNAEEGRVNP